ncbi:MFS family permease [Bradyrhizobium japonicum]
MIALIAKIVLGPVLFVLILFAAQSIRLRWAAGMLLTFPALNGIGLFVASPKSIALSPPMIPMIVVNGILCFLYVTIIQNGGRVFGTVFSPSMLFLMGLALWVLVFFLDMEISRELQPAFVIVCLAIALAFTRWLWVKRERHSALGGSKTFWEFLQNWKEWRARALIFLFLLSVFAASSYVGADSVAGRLGAAPILPLFALHSLATGNDPHAKMAATKATIFLGPIVAMCFVIFFAEAVYQHGFWFGLSCLAVGWLLCLLCIYAIARGLDELDRRGSIS